MKSKLLQLFADNRGRAKALAPLSRIVQAAGSKEATMYLYDPIVSDKWEAEYFGGVCPQDFVPALVAIDADTINLHINSPGGDVFAAQAMATAIKQHKANVVAHIDGIAASAATTIACACDKVVMADGAMYMIHNAWTIALGDRNDFRDTADLLEKIDGTLADAYAARTGKDKAEMSALMDAETWFTAQEAIDIGLADSMAETKAKAQAWNLSAYAKAPRAAAPADPDPAEDEGLSADEAQFLRALVAHDAAAVALAKSALPLCDNDDVEDIAECVITESSGRIALMTTWLEQAPAEAENRAMTQTNANRLRLAQIA